MDNTLKQAPNKLIKVVLFGPECTGKSTLSKQLATHYNTVLVPEFLREFAQKKWNNEQKVCEEKDITAIAKGQMQLENEAAKTANKLLICDTDLLETKVYAESYFEGFTNTELDSAISNNNYDLYFLTYIDVPWQADDLRDRAALREEMFTQFENALRKNNKNYLLLKGNKTARLKTAITTIDKLITNTLNLT